MKRIPFLFLCLSFLLPLTAQDSPGRRTSLWNNDAALFADPKAKGINDIVIIRVEENTKASNKGGSKTAKSGSSSLGVDSFLGFETSLAGKITNSSFDPKNLFGHTSTKNDSGSGEVTQNTSLTGYIAAKVVECLPNGNMVIEAKKEIKERIGRSTDLADALLLSLCAKWRERDKSYLREILTGSKRRREPINDGSTWMSQ